MHTVFTPFAKPCVWSSDLFDLLFNLTQLLFLADCDIVHFADYCDGHIKCCLLHRYLYKYSL